MDLLITSLVLCFCFFFGEGVSNSFTDRGQLFVIVSQANACCGHSGYRGLCVSSACSFGSAAPSGGGGTDSPEKEQVTGSAVRRCNREELIRAACERKDGCEGFSHRAASRVPWWPHVLPLDQKGWQPWIEEILHPFHNDRAWLVTKGTNMSESQTFYVEYFKV